MSVLAMILTAAMALPGDGPEKVSGELERSPQPLDLRGEWKGKLTNGNGRIFEGKIKGAIFVVTLKETPLVDLRHECITDEGNGRSFVGRDAKAPVMLGIYKHEVTS